MEALKNVLRSEGFSFWLLTIGLLLVFVILVLAIIKLVRDLQADKGRRETMKLVKFLQEQGADNIEKLLNEDVKKIEKLSAKVKTLEGRMERAEGNLAQSIQKIAIIRFNAFRSAGSNLSYSIALLDYHNDGIIITSIFARDSGGQTYAKPVSNGKSNYTLCEEEEVVLKKAMEQPVRNIGVLKESERGKEVFPDIMTDTANHADYRDFGKQRAHNANAIHSTRKEADERTDPQSKVKEKKEEDWESKWEEYQRAYAKTSGLQKR